MNNKHFSPTAYFVASHPSRLLNKYEYRNIAPLQPFERSIARSQFFHQNPIFWVKHAISSISYIISSLLNIVFVWYSLIAAIVQFATMDIAQTSTDFQLREATIYALQSLDIAIAAFECTMVSSFFILMILGCCEACIKRGSRAPHYNWNRFWLNFRRITFSVLQFSFSLNLFFESLGRMIRFIQTLYRWSFSLSEWLLGLTNVSNMRTAPLYRRVLRYVFSWTFHILTIVPFAVSCIFLLAILIGLGTCAIIIKIINVYQEALFFNITDWTVFQWVALVGFLNQLSSASSMGENDREELLDIFKMLDSTTVNVIDREEDNYGPYSSDSKWRSKFLRRLAISYVYIYIFIILAVCVCFFCGGWILVFLTAIFLGFYFLSGFDEGITLAFSVEVSPTLEKLTRSLLPFKRLTFLSEFIATLMIEIVDEDILVDGIKIMHLRDIAEFSDQLSNHIIPDLLPGKAQVIARSKFHDSLTCFAVHYQKKKIIPLLGKKPNIVEILISNPKNRAFLLEDFQVDISGYEVVETNHIVSSSKGNHRCFVFVPPNAFHLCVMKLKRIDSTFDMIGFSHKPRVMESKSHESFESRCGSLLLHRWFFDPHFHCLSVENIDRRHTRRPLFDIWGIVNCKVKYFQRYVETEDETIKDIILTPHFSSVKTTLFSHHDAIALIECEKDWRYTYELSSDRLKNKKRR